MERISDFKQLHITMNANEVAAVLGISRSAAYALMHSEGFPVIRIGKRMVVYRDRFVEWMDKQIVS